MVMSARGDSVTSLSLPPQVLVVFVLGVCSQLIVIVSSHDSLLVVIVPAFSGDSVR